MRPVEINQYDITMASHYDITMGNIVTRDVHCEITMGNDIARDVSIVTSQCVMTLLRVHIIVS